jgi:hypothetical protein
MTTQTQPRTLCLSEFIVVLPLAETVRINPCDYGFDFDEQELGREMTAQLPYHLAAQPRMEVTADEFETIFQTFLS